MLKRRILTAAGLVCAVILMLYGLSLRHGQHYRPDYERVNLREVLEREDGSELNQAQLELIFLQTGLGEKAVSKLSAEEVLAAQEHFFAQEETECRSAFYGLVWEESRKTPGETLCLEAVQPGDIIISLSTHTLGWLHGHAGLILSDGRVLESTLIGSDSGIFSLQHWNRYAGYAVVRVRNLPEAAGRRAALFAEQSLTEVPYRLTAGLRGEKFRERKEEGFGVQCAYLVWYAWMEQGIDLDSDGGRIVTPEDILFSERVEIVQIYGMNPELFKP